MSQPLQAHKIKLGAPAMPVSAVPSLLQQAIGLQNQQRLRSMQYLGPVGSCLLNAGGPQQLLPLLCAPQQGRVETLEGQGAYEGRPLRLLPLHTGRKILLEICKILQGWILPMSSEPAS